MSDTKEFLSGKAILWAWLPLAFLMFKIVTEATLPREVVQAMNNENGFTELLQAAIISAACILGLVIVFKGWKTTSWPVKLWITLGALGAFYIAGEEVSWGQHFFYWDTPENWQAINDQQETNLHNTSSWFDQKPRLIILIGVVVGGLIMPLIRKVKPSLLPARFNIIYPENLMWLIAAIVLILKIADKVAETAAFPFFTRVSEIEETYLYYFILLYLVTMYPRLIGAAQAK